MSIVLHITECFAGGVGQAIYTAAKLAPEHIHILLWAGDEEPREGVFAATFSLPVGFFARVLAVRQAVERNRPDVVHAHSSWAGVYARLLPLDTRLVYQPHCYKFDDPDSAGPFRWAYRLAERVLAPRADTVVVLSPHEDALARALHPTGRRLLLPNVPTLRPDGTFARGSADRFFMMGRLARQKDPDYFSRVSQVIVQQRPTAESVWVGDGDPVARRKLERAGVRVTGWLDRAELNQLLSEGGVYFHSASYEGFPLSILDAAAFDVPVVARSIDALRGAPIYQAGSERDAARRVVALLGGDEGLMEEARQANLDLLQQMSDERHASGLASLYLTRRGVAA